jgi:Cu/Zn superoxide dismutase
MKRAARYLSLFAVVALALFVSLGVASPTLAQDADSLTISLHDTSTRMVGSATLTQTDAGVMIEMTVNGMAPEPGDRSVMIHEVGVCEAPDFLSSVGPMIHLLPPAQFYINGGTTYKVVTDEFTLAELMDADGSSLDIHADVPPTPGPIIICGVIPAGTGVAQPTTPEMPPAPAPAPTMPPAPAPAPPAPAPTTPPAPAPAPAPTTPDTGACPQTLREAVEEGAGAFLIDAQGRDVGFSLMLEGPECQVEVLVFVVGMQAVGGNRAMTITDAALCDAPAFETAGDILYELPPAQMFPGGNIDYVEVLEPFGLSTLMDANGSSLVLHADESTASDRILCGQIIDMPTFLDAVGLTVDDFIDILEG